MRFGQTLLLSIAVMLPSLSSAAVLELITLKDGKQVQLNDDFSWQYVLTSQTTKNGTHQPDDQTGPVLSHQALIHPELLTMTAAQGVQVKLDHQQTDKERMGLVLSLDNLAEESVVAIRGRISLYSPQGKLLTQQETAFWQAEYRMPETYLRKGQPRNSQILWIPTPAEAASVLIRLEILDVERR